jgi:hypothetical protein
MTGSPSRVTLKYMRPSPPGVLSKQCASMKSMQDFAASRYSGFRSISE